MIFQMQKIKVKMQLRRLIVRALFWFCFEHLGTSFNEHVYLQGLSYEQLLSVAGDEIFSYSGKYFPVRLQLQV